MPNDCMALAVSATGLGKRIRDLNEPAPVTGALLTLADADRLDIAAQLFVDSVLLSETSFAWGMDY